jgi:simple sugar transport system permease protein
MGNFSLRRLFRSLLIPVLAVFTALIVGAVIMWLAGDNPIAAYKGLFQGAFGSARGWATTIRKWSPLLLTGLSVAIAFQAGLFNIGASGQFMMGTIFSVWVGINFAEMPAIIHVPLAISAGILGGLLWGAIPGILKVTTGAHEVITTIMLNYIAALFAGWTVYAGGSQGQKSGPLWDPAAKAISQTPPVVESARIPFIFGPPYRVHWGIALAIITIFVMAWLIYKTTIGFELRTVGQNFKASKYAGIRVGWTIILAMMLAGALAGMAGAIETLGVNFKFAPEFGGSVGFDGITVALLGQTNPFGVGLAAFFLASLAAGGAKMQFDSGVSSDIIQVINALLLAFVAAPAIIRYIYRIRKAPEEAETTPKISWGGG